MTNTNYKFKNQVLKTEKQKTIEYKLIDFTLDEPLIKIYLSISSKYWSLYLTVNGQKKYIRSLSYLDANKVKNVIEPNKYAHDERVYYFEQIVDMLCYFHLNNSLCDYLSIEKQAHEYTIKDIVTHYLRNKHTQVEKRSFEHVYIIHANHFIRQYGNLSIFEFQRLSKQNIHNNINDLIEAKKWSNSTLKMHKGIVSNIIHFINENSQDYLLKEPIKNQFVSYKNNSISIEKVKFEAYSNHEYSIIMNTIKENPRLEMLGLFLEMMFYTHARPIELMRMQLKDIDFNRNQLTIYNHKSKKKRVIDMPIHLIQKMRSKITYINTTMIEDYYFFGAYGRYVQETIINKNRLVNQFIKYIRTPHNLNPNISVYSMKHYTNIFKYKQGLTLIQLMKLNGHASISMTEKYLRDLIRDFELDSDIINIAMPPIAI